MGTWRAGLLLTTFSISCLAEPDPDEIGRQAAESRVAVSWTSPVNVTASGDDLTKSGGFNTWNAGAVSSQVIPRDGYVEFTTAENTTFKMAGLSNGNSDASDGDIDFAIRLAADGSVGIRERGRRTPGDFGAYAAGDVFRVQVIDDEVTYWRNGLLIATSNGPPPQRPLQVDTSLKTPGATIRDAVIEDALFWDGAVNTGADGNDLTKTAGGRAWNAGASSARSLHADGEARFTTGENTTAKMVGLSSGSAGQSYEEIDFAMFLRADGTIAVRENGILRGQDLATYQAGDDLRIAVSAGVVTYSVNGEVFYTSSGTPSFPLLLDTSLRTVGATIQDAVLVHAPTPVTLFDNSAAVFDWEGGFRGETGDQDGAYLDVTLSAAAQTGQANVRGVQWIYFDTVGNTSPGGIAFWPRSTFPTNGARFAAGATFVIQGNEPWGAQHPTPARVLQAGDAVGPFDTWEPSVSNAHFQDASDETGPSVTWFSAGIIGVRITAADGIHYGFVDVQPGYTPIRWGYNPNPNQPIVIPP